MSELPANDDHIYVLFEDCIIETTNAFIKLTIDSIKAHPINESKHEVIKHSIKIKNRKRAYLEGGDTWKEMAETVLVYCCLKYVIFGTGFAFMDKSEYDRMTKSKI